MHVAVLHSQFLKSSFLKKWFFFTKIAIDIAEFCFESYELIETTIEVSRELVRNSKS